MQIYTYIKQAIVPGENTQNTEHAHVLRRILDRCDSKNIPPVAVFVDFKKSV